MNREEFQKAYGQLVAKAWADENFKARLLADPMTVLKDNGLEMPEGVEARVVENTDKIIYLILPPAPSDEMGEENLDKVSGGGFNCFSFSPPPLCTSGMGCCTSL